MAVAIQIKNLKEFRARMQQAPDITLKHVDRAIRDSIFSVEREAKPITPVKTGRLLGSYVSRFAKLRGKLVAGERGKVKEYAERVHSLYSPGVRYKNPSKNPRAVAGFMIVGAKNASSSIEDAFQTAADNITRDLGD